MFDLQDFTFTQMIRAGATLRKLGDGAHNLEEVGGRIVRYFYDEFTSGSQRACVLARFFKTHAFGALDEELRQAATAMLGTATSFPTMKCLVLLASAGDRPEWNSRRTSKGHKAIPLASESALKNLPMISQLLVQQGFSVGELLNPDPALMLDVEQVAFNVFHVPEAEGSLHIPAQKDFVVPYGVRSVLGFGGALPGNDFFVVILFTRVKVPRQTADLFKTLALSIKLAVVPFAQQKSIFAEDPAEIEG